MTNLASDIPSQQSPPQVVLAFGAALLTGRRRFDFNDHRHRRLIDRARKEPK